jgi:hypothetical protein
MFRSSLLFSTNFYFLFRKPLAMFKRSLTIFPKRCLFHTQAILRESSTIFKRYLFHGQKASALNYFLKIFISRSEGLRPCSEGPSLYFQKYVHFILRPYSEGPQLFSTDICFMARRRQPLIIFKRCLFHVQKASGHVQKVLNYIFKRC